MGPLRDQTTLDSHWGSSLQEAALVSKIALKVCNLMT